MSTMPTSSGILTWKKKKKKKSSPVRNSRRQSPWWLLRLCKACKCNALHRVYTSWVTSWVYVSSMETVARYLSTCREPWTLSNYRSANQVNLYTTCTTSNYRSQKFSFIIIIHKFLNKFFFYLITPTIIWSH